MVPIRITADGTFVFLEIITGRIMASTSEAKIMLYKLNPIAVPT
jgi:hypothetical protein